MRSCFPPTASSMRPRPPTSVSTARSSWRLRKPISPATWRRCPRPSSTRRSCCDAIARREPSVPAASWSAERRSRRLPTTCSLRSRCCNRVLRLVNCAEQRRRIRRRWIDIALLRAAAACVALIAPAPSLAQTDLRPADERPELPEPTGRRDEPVLVLPPVLEPPAGGLDSGLQITVRAFEVVGSTVFSQGELQAITEPATGRPLHTEELHAVRDAIT